MLLLYIKKMKLRDLFFEHYFLIFNILYKIILNLSFNQKCSIWGLGIGDWG